MLVISHLNSRNTCTQEPLARLPNSFSVITVILLINMPIPFKFDSYKNFANNLNAASSLGLGSKKCSKHFTLVNNIPMSICILQYRFTIIFLVNQSQSYKTHWKIFVSLLGIEPGTSGVVLQWTNHYTNRAITIAVYKHYFDNSVAEPFLKERLVFQKRQPQSFKRWEIPVKLAYLQCNILKVMAVEYYFCKIVCCLT